MQLSERLKLVASFVTEGNILADVGTDHGYIPIYLVENEVIPSAIAMDINKGPLERAGEHILEHGLVDKITTRLSDGLSKLKDNEAETVLIAGMGGALTVRILEDGKEVLKNVKELVLSPHSEISLVRYFLINNGYKIVKEAMIYDLGKYYTVIKAIHTTTSINLDKAEYDDNRSFYLFGRELVLNKDKVLFEFLQKEVIQIKSIIEVIDNNEKANERRKELSEKLEIIQEVLRMED